MRHTLHPHKASFYPKTRETLNGPSDLITSMLYKLYDLWYLNTYIWLVYESYFWKEYLLHAALGLSKSPVKLGVTLCTKLSTDSWKKTDTTNSCKVKFSCFDVAPACWRRTWLAPHGCPSSAPNSPVPVWKHFIAVEILKFQGEFCCPSSSACFGRWSSLTSGLDF